MLPCDQERVKLARAADKLAKQQSKPKKTYTIPKESAKRKAAREAGTWKPKEVKPIAKEAKRRAAQNREYRTKTMPQYKKDNPICERCRCRDTTDVHHKKGRIEKLLNDTDYFIALCRPCHNWAEANGEAAKAEGISVLRYN